VRPRTRTRDRATGGTDASHGQFATHQHHQAQSKAKSNGKAERFIRTMLAGWAYGAIYRSSTDRNAALAGWIGWYNTRRPHGALSHKPPIARLTELNNPRVPQMYSVWTTERGTFEDAR
jgi:transposase InsO family protein